MIKNGLLSINASKSFISTNGTSYLSNEFLVGSSLPFLNKSTNNRLIFINVGSIRRSKLLVFGCVFILDLYLFHEIVLLNDCIIFSKNLILSLIDKVTTGT